jgi:hypothetical protein
MFIRKVFLCSCRLRGVAFRILIYGSILKCIKELLVKNLILAGVAFSRKSKIIYTVHIWTHNAVLEEENVRTKNNCSHGQDNFVTV